LYNRCRYITLCGVNPSFEGLSPWDGQVAHALRTRAPLSPPASWWIPFDLHVLGLPLAFILSQDQTLHCKNEVIDLTRYSRNQSLLLCLLLIDLGLFFNFRLKTDYSLRYMNINIFKNYLASARASAFISRRFRTGRFFSLSNTGCIALPGRNFLLSNPCSVWDCKGRNLFLKTKNIFLFFFFPLPRFRGPPFHQF